MPEYVIPLWQDESLSSKSNVCKVNFQVGCQSIQKILALGFCTQSLHKSILFHFLNLIENYLVSIIQKNPLSICTDLRAIFLNALFVCLYWQALFF